MTGKHLRAWRKRMKLTVKEAAEQLGVSPATFSRWAATDQVLPRYVGLACAAVSLNLPPSEG